MRKVLALMAVMLFLCFGFAHAEEVTVTGTLTKTVAIGGETTGWGVNLDKPIQIEGKTFTLIEIYVGEVDLQPLEGIRVTVTGDFVKRTGIERTYWVIDVTEMSWGSSAALSPGIVLVDCYSMCDGQLATCDQGCGYLKNEKDQVRCRNRCLSGFFSCLKRCEKRSEAPWEFKPCSALDDVGAGCIEQGQTCTKYGTPCCEPYSCDGKFPNTTCQ